MSEMGDLFITVTLAVTKVCNNYGTIAYSTEASKIFQAMSPINVNYYRLLLVLYLGYRLNASILRDGMDIVFNVS